VALERLRSEAGPPEALVGARVSVLWAEEKKEGGARHRFRRIRPLTTKKRKFALRSAFVVRVVCYEGANPSSEAGPPEALVGARVSVLWAEEKEEGGALHRFRRIRP